MKLCLGYDGGGNEDGAAMGFFLLMVRRLGFLPNETSILGLPHPGEAQADVSQASSLMSRTAVGGEETQSLLKMSPGGINYTLLKGPEGE